jgi:hypothetical protein
MSSGTHRLADAIFLLLTGAGRVRFRRLQDAETEALVVARRIHMLRQLACMAEYQLGIVDLARLQAVTAQPDVESWAGRVLDAFSEATARQLDEYSRH